MLNEEIISLKKLVVEYTFHIENMLSLSAKGVFERDGVPLGVVINEEEPVSNKMELFLDEKAVSVIAKFQPVAKNLRIIISIIKMNTSLERIGDHCVNIARSGLYLTKHAPVKPFIDLPKMKDIVREMLHLSSDALIRQDIELAKQVVLMDEEVDKYKKNIIKELTDMLTAKSASAAGILEIINITNNLERIADLSTNICEDVIYMEIGKVVKHANPFMVK